KLDTSGAAGDQWNPPERRSRSRQPHRARSDRGASCVGSTLTCRGDAPAATEPTKPRVDAADMVEQQKDQHAIGRSRYLELPQQPIKIEDRSLALAGRARAEQNQTGRIAFLESPQQRMADRTVEAGSVP